MKRDKIALDSLIELNKRVLPELCRLFYNKGLSALEIKRITRDILNIIGDGGFYSAAILNRKLQGLGWGKNIVDNYIFALLLYYLKCEGTYKVDAYYEKQNIITAKSPRRASPQS